MSRPPPRGRRERAFDTRGLAFTPYSLSAKYSLPADSRPDLLDDEVVADEHALRNKADETAAANAKRTREDRKLWSIRNGPCFPSVRTASRQQLTRLVSSAAGRRT